MACMYKRNGKAIFRELQPESKVPDTVQATARTANSFGPVGSQLGRRISFRGDELW